MGIKRVIAEIEYDINMYNHTYLEDKGNDYLNKDLYRRLGLELQNILSIEEIKNHEFIHRKRIEGIVIDIPTWIKILNLIKDIHFNNNSLDVVQKSRIENLVQLIKNR